MAGNLKLAFILEAVDRATAPLKRVNERIDKLTQPLRRVRAAMGAVRAASGFERVQSRWADLSNAGSRMLGTFQRIAGVVAGLGFAAAGAFYGFKRVADGINETLDRASHLNLAVEDLQRIQHAAEMSGSSSEEMASALEYLARQMGAATSGSKEVQTWFARVGVTMNDLKSSNAIQVWEKLTAKFKQLPNEGGNFEKKIAVLTALTGRSSQGLVEMADVGTEGLRALYREADRLGIVVSRVDAEALAGFNQGFGRMRATLFGVAAAISARLLPVLNPIVERITAWAARNRELVATRVAEFIERIVPKLPVMFESISQLVGGIGKAVMIADRFAQAIGGWQVVLGALTAILAGSALSALWGFGAAMFSLNAAFLLTPFGWFVTGVTAVVGAVALLISKWEWVSDLIDQATAGFRRFIGVSDEAAQSPAGPQSRTAVAPRRGGAGGPFEGMGEGSTAQIGTGVLRIELAPGMRPKEVVRPDGGLIDLDVYMGRTLPGW